MVDKWGIPKKKKNYSNWICIVLWITNPDLKIFVSNQ